jgi:hypothetical protein
MTNFDLPNLILMFAESLDRIVSHLENGYPDRALMRAKETQKAMCRLKKHLGIEEQELINKL